MVTAVVRKRAFAIVLACAELLLLCDSHSLMLKALRGRVKMGASEAVEDFRYVQKSEGQTL